MHTRDRGCGFPGVRVRVAQKNPRVARECRDNPYLILQLWFCLRLHHYIHYLALLLLLLPLNFYHPTASQVQQPPTPINAWAGDKKRTLQLGNGHSITFTAQDVPPPPTTTFTDNIPRLNSMWDDTSMYWDQDSVLRILGYPIALVYWPIVYTRWRAGDWDTLKTQFGHWKVC
jgi:hypothetical protein